MRATATSFGERLRHVPRRLVVRFALFVAVVLAVVAAFRFTPLADLITKEALLAAVGTLQQAWWAPFALVACWALLCPLGAPATPFMIAGGVIFGPVLGSGLNLLGSFVGALIGFSLARHLGGEFLHHLAGPRLKRVERQVHRHGFWSLVALRFVPIPFPAVNFGCALAGARFGRFALASAIGLAPSILLWTIFYAAFYRAAAGESKAMLYKTMAALLAFAFVSTLPAFIRRRRRIWRYKRLLAERAGRAQLRLTRRSTSAHS